MSHVEAVNLDIDAAINKELFRPALSFKRVMWICVFAGVITGCLALIFASKEHFWGVFYSNTLFWMGLSLGGTMISVIFQIVHAKWAPPVRRLAEANIAFFPYAFIAFLTTYFGRAVLFYWGREKMPGREWWMQSDFVYLRNGLLMAFLFALLSYFVRLSLRVDVGFAKSRAKGTDKWEKSMYQGLISKWRGDEAEIERTERKRSHMAPAIVFLYAIIYSLVAFEMVMGMNPPFVSNMFGGFMFIGNIFGGWAVLAITVVFMRNADAEYSKMAGKQQLHDLGKLTFGFAILWAYLFLAQFLPIWYTNMPEETQWMIARTREAPWKYIGWFVFGACFVVPFLTLISRDVKRTSQTLATMCMLILIGLWTERYLLVMPEMSPHHVPFGILEIGLTLGFLGAYVLSVQHFLETYPVIPVSDPLCRQGHGH